MEIIQKNGDGPGNGNKPKPDTEHWPQATPHNLDALENPKNWIASSPTPQTVPALENAPKTETSPDQNSTMQPAISPLWKRVLRRYGPAEVIGSLTAIGGGYGAFLYGAGPVLTALAGTIAENVGYYGTILLTDYVKRVEAAKGAGIFKRFVMPIGTTILAVGAEFGAAEIVDSGFSRPALMWAGQAASNALGGGIIGRAAGFMIGKLAADAIFYSIVIPNKAALDKAVAWFIKGRPPKP